ncbi:LysR family transcriptional regulator [Micromonospora sp. NPDC051141]|uniref:LysR family transcriptional regulator n=1 Tax=Micromonospora sp. NPDC051141 TaxID=3364284 RepID=UPI0037B64839
MDIDIRSLRTFIAVAEELSFTRAAVRLSLPQPSVSNQIRRLERQLGRTLFERSTRHVTLTQEGRDLLRQALAVDHAMRRLEAGTHEQSMLRVGIEALDLRAALDQLRRQLPQTALTVTIGPSDDLVAGLTAGQLDLVQYLDFAELPTILPDSVWAEKVGESPLWAVVWRTHPLATRKRVSLRELCAHPWICRPPGTSARRHLELICAQAGVTPLIHYVGLTREAYDVCLREFHAVTLGTPVGLANQDLVTIPLVDPISQPVLVAWHPHRVPVDVGRRFARLVADGNRTNLARISALPPAP